MGKTGRPRSEVIRECAVDFTTSYEPKESGQGQLKDLRFTTAAVGRIEYSLCTGSTRSNETFGLRGAVCGPTTRVAEIR